MEDIKKKIDIALQLHQKGKVNDAISLYLKIFSKHEKNSQLLFLLGTAYLQINKFDIAIKYLKKSISLDKNNLGGYNNLGAALQNIKYYDDAVDVYSKLIEIKPNSFEAYTNIANCYFHKKNYNAAIENYKKSLEINSKNYIAYNNLGNTFKELGNYEEAIKSYNRTLDFNSNYYVAYYNLGKTFQSIKRYDEAIKNYEKLIELKPDYKYAFGNAIHAKMLICDWENYDDKIENIINLIDQNYKTITPYQIISLIDEPEFHKLSSEIFAKEKFTISKKNQTDKILEKNSKIKLGYFSPDFRDHAVLHLIMDVFKNHNKSKFEIYAFSFGPEDDEMTEEIKKYFTKFIDIRKKSDEEVLKLCQKFGIDIAIDLCGYTAWNRAEIFSKRLAPIQINYLGYPGTMGSKLIDYIIADEIVIPEKYKNNYLEKVIYLPNSYQPNVKNKKISSNNFKREDFGLPSESFVFCNFNSSHKINPKIFDIWMKILKEVPNSVLWLLKSNSLASENLWKEAKKRNIEENKIIFAEYMSNDQHLERIKLADLFLDTFPYNAHTTASDAIRMGIPIITLMGKSFASRVSSSILNQVNLSELVTTNKDDLKNLAINLAKDKKKLKKVKDSLKNSLSKSALFDSVKYTGDLENIFLKLLNEKN